VKKLTFFASLIISALALYLAFSNLNLKEAFAYMKRMNPWDLLAGSLIFVISFLLRGIRWKLILKKSSGISLPLATANIFIGQFGNNILPWRMGDVWRTIMLKRMVDLPLVSGGVGLGVERLYDGIVIVTMGIVASSYYAIHTRMLKTLYTLLGVLIGVFVILLLFLRIFGHREGRFIQNLSRGIDSLKNPRDFLFLLAFSFFIWTVESVSFYYFFLAAGFSLRILEIFLVVAILNLVLLLPAAPASLGTFEYAIVFATKLLSIPKEASLPLALVIHFLRFLSINVVAVLFAFLLGLSLKREIKEVEKEADKVEAEVL